MSKKRIWIGRIISGCAVAFLLIDAVIHILNIPVVAAALSDLGYPRTIGPVLGWIMVVCLVLYVIPRTATLGAVLATGYLGGAVATHVRVEDPLFTHILFPVYIGLLLWYGLYLRNQRVAALLPFHRT
jgi:hypothetical protein